MTEVPCATCGGFGLLPHPMRGQITCPDPWEECRDCLGTGVDGGDPGEQQAIDHMIEQQRGVA